jgi:hypothetical protein
MLANHQIALGLLFFSSSFNISNVHQLGGQHNLAQCPSFLETFPTTHSRLLYCMCSCAHSWNRTSLYAIKAPDNSTAPDGRVKFLFDVSLASAMPPEEEKNSSTLSLSGHQIGRRIQLKLTAKRKTHIR